MRYAFLIDGNAHHVTIEEHADGPKFMVDGVAYDPEVFVEEDQSVVKVGGQSFPFSFAEGRINLGNQVLDVEVRRAKPALVRAGGKARRGSGHIKPPMPGKVIEVHVREGDVVEEGSPLLVLEAMKMQNELKAPVAGIVSSVKVKPGQNVESSTIMLEIEPAQE